MLYFWLTFFSHRNSGSKDRDLFFWMTFVPLENLTSKNQGLLKGWKSDFWTSKHQSLAIFFSEGGEVQLVHPKPLQSPPLKPLKPLNFLGVQGAPSTPSSRKNCAVKGGLFQNDSLIKIWFSSSNHPKRNGILKVYYLKHEIHQYEKFLKF